MPQKLVDTIKNKLGEEVLSSVSFPYAGEIHLETELENIISLASLLYNNLGFSLIQMLANDQRATKGNFALYYTFASSKDKFVVVISTGVNPSSKTFPSITLTVPAAQWYEREIRDQYGLVPQGHPDLRRLMLHKDWPKNLHPMLREFKLTEEVPRTPGKFSFQRVAGEGVIEIPVGPIHAGIIEPGHFRFSAVGENVIHVEARLFYTHRGMEKRIEGANPVEGLLYAERICGACSFSHSTAYCQALEKLSGTPLSPRAAFIRTIGLELERLNNHIGDVGNICAGIGLAFGTMQGARLKEELMRLNEIVFGSRFLRGINTPGGVRRDIEKNKEELIVGTLEKVKKQFKELTDILLSTDSYLDRVEGTGILKYKVAKDLHAVGVAARASGIDLDARRDQPYAAYEKLPFRVPVYTEGDVLARVRVRIDEAFESFALIKQALTIMPRGELTVPLGKIEPYSYAVSITESPRGENIHFVMVDDESNIYRYMVRSASYCNWQVFPSTIPGNIVPDFPLINKSFELCYSCLDR